MFHNIFITFESRSLYYLILYIRFTSILFSNYEILQFIEKLVLLHVYHMIVIQGSIHPCILLLSNSISFLFPIALGYTSISFLFSLEKYVLNNPFYSSLISRKLTFIIIIFIG